MMRILPIFIAITTLSIIVPSSVSAALFSGAYLLQVCEKDDHGKEPSAGSHATCQAYIAGVIDYHNVLQSLNIAPKVDICIPPNVTMNDLHNVVLNYLRHHGEHDSFVASPAVTMALFEKYPCR